MRIFTSLDGVEGTVAKMKSWDLEKRAKLKTIVKKTATAVRAEARNKVPVSPANRLKTKRKDGTRSQPGDLKASISAKYRLEGLGAMVLPLRPKGNHRYIVEEGTKQRFNKKGQNRGSVSPQPFMEPAKESQLSSYNAAMIELFKNEEEI